MLESADEMLASMCADLRLLWRQAGGPSLRTLQGRLGLGKSQLGAILGGQVRRPPDWTIVSGLVTAFHRYAADHGRLSRLSLRTGVDEYWRPRYHLLEHAFTAGPRPAAPAPVDAHAPPAMLPSAVPGFAGRERELAALDRTAAEAGTSPAVVISAVSGMAGVGKTALAVHWSHRVAHRFPDGQLYVNLRGYDPSRPAVETTDALGGLLDALGVPGDRVPADVTARSALFRSVLAGRKLLVLLDNARDTEQVRPLLPGVPGCVAVVTSRNELAGLVAVDAAVPLTLDVLSRQEAHDLLVHRLGPARLAAEPDAAAEIVDRCARLPLALAIVAARAATRPGFPLAALAADLRTSAGLDGLHGGDRSTDVRGIFACSYRELSPEAARLFRRLALHPGRDLTIDAAASLDAAPRRAVRDRLGELTGAHLLTEVAPGRYAYHDLLLAYAVERAWAEDPADQRDAATGRLLDHLLHTTVAATTRLYPMRDPVAVDPPRPGVVVERFDDRDPALAWFDAERHNLRAAVAHAADRGFDAHAWKLAWAGRVHLARSGLWREYEEIARIALDATQRLGDRGAEADARRTLGVGLLRLGRPDDAAGHFRAALAAYADLDDAAGQATTHLALENLTDDPAEALHHATRAADLYRSIGHRAGEANALNAIGWSHALRGDFTRALDHCERALAIQREIGDLEGQAATWDSLGYAHHGRADHARARHCYERCLAIYRQLGYRYREADTLVRLGDAHRDAADARAARRAWRRALSILDSLDHPDAGPVRQRLRALTAGNASTPG